jgi:O-antigen ligase
LHPTIYWSFVFFVFTLPLESVDIGPLSGALSLTKLCALALFGFYAFFHNPIVGKPQFAQPPAAFWWFLGYGGVFLLAVVSVSEEFRVALLSRMMTMAQLLILFLIASVLLRDQKIATHALLAYAFGSVVLALGILFNVPIISDEAFENHQNRVGLLEIDANSLATMMSLGVLILVGLCLSDLIKKIHLKLLLILLTVPPFVLGLRTGSRGGFAALVVGLSVFIVPTWNLKKTFRAIFIAGIAITGVTLAVMSDSDMSERFEEAFEGRLSGRENIFPIAFDMFQQKSLFGWHPVEMWYELGKRTTRPGETRDAHSLYLHLLLEVGIVGTLPFVIGLWLCGRAAWRARQGPFGWLPLAALILILSVNISLTDLARKHFWLVLALSTAVTYPQVRQIRSRSTFS